MKTSSPTKEISGYRLIFGYLGMFMMLIGIIVAVPLVILIFHPEELEALPMFGGVSLGYIVIGLALYFSLIFKRKRSRFMRHEESMLLILTWLLAILSGAAPFYIASLTGHMHMSFTMSCYESASGYSTTGLTVFSDFIDVPNAYCPYIFTFHRAFTNYIGGMGLVLLLASILGAGSGGMSLYVSEGHSDHLLPNIARSAKLIFGIYAFYTLVGTIAFILSGMPAFDAVTHSMSAISGGGFSCRSDNIASYRYLDGQVLEGGFVAVNSLAIEIIIIVEVCFSGISFMLHTFLLRGKFKKFISDDEIVFAAGSAGLFLAITFFGALIATRNAHAGGFFADSGEIFRQSIFYVLGAMTNSGFASSAADNSQFAYHIVQGSAANSPIFLGHGFVISLIILMLIGGGAGSTAGGIKQYRVAIAMRSLWYSIRYRFASIHQHYPKLTKRYGHTGELSDDSIFEAHHYILLFIGLFIALTIGVLCADPDNYYLEAAAFDVASAISNTGLNMIVSSNYVAANSVTGPVVLWMLTIGMILGRLEIFPAVYAMSNIGEEIKHHHILRRRAKRESAALQAMEEE